MKIADLDLINSSRMTLIHFKLKILYYSKGAAASPEMLGGAFWQVYFMIRRTTIQFWSEARWLCCEPGARRVKIK